MVKDRADLEAWLRDQVVPSYDAAMVDRTRLTPADEVLDGIAARYEARLRDNEPQNGAGASAPPETGGVRRPR